MFKAPIRIMLVDDDEDDYILTRDLLADIPDFRFELDWVCDVDAALEAMSEGGRDLYLVDYRLGRLDGLDLTREAVARGCSAPIILLTGMSDRAVDLDAMRAGAADFLEKGGLNSVLLERSIRYSLQEKRHAESLERRVRERTAELARANEALKRQIADRARAEEALRAADRRKNEYLSTLAHELRTPLSPIRNALEIMKLAGNAPEVVESSRAMIERQLKHLIRLIDDLMDVARISRGRLKLKLDSVEAALIVSEAVESVRSLLDKTHRELSVSIPKESLLLRADPARLAQVLYNLLHNAIKYTDPGGKIRLTAERDGGEAVFRVEDDGLGVPPEMLESIFEIFTQVKQTDGSLASGLGIGLSLVKTLAELHGGRVEAHSDGPGRGSEFTVRIPIDAGGDEP